MNKKMIFIAVLIFCISVPAFSAMANEDWKGLWMISYQVPIDSGYTYIPIRLDDQGSVFAENGDFLGVWYVTYQVVNGGNAYFRLLNIDIGMDRFCVLYGGVEDFGCGRAKVAGTKSSMWIPFDIPFKITRLKK